MVMQSDNREAHAPRIADELFRRAADATSRYYMMKATQLVLAVMRACRIASIELRMLDYVQNDGLDIVHTQNAAGYDVLRLVRTREGAYIPGVESAPVLPGEPAADSPFVVRPNVGETMPSIKGNGFDGLTFAEDRETVERFVAYVNERMRFVRAPDEVVWDAPPRPGTVRVEASAPSVTEEALSASVEIDDENDVLTAFGTRISGALLRLLGKPTPSGEWFRVVQVENGLATIEVRRDVEPNQEAP